jgi:Concanavalin A-like lectin/glucanases superfamily
MKRFFPLLVLLIFAGMSSRAFSQQPANPAPVMALNAKSVQGRTWADFQVTAGTGLTVNIAAGTATCGNPPVSQQANAGTLTLTAGTTNYIYLSPSNCAAASNTTGFPSGVVALAKVTTDSHSVTGITDARTMIAPTALLDSGGKVPAGLLPIGTTGGTVAAGDDSRFGASLAIGSQVGNGPVVGQALAVDGNGKLVQHGLTLFSEDMPSADCGARIAAAEAILYAAGGGTVDATGDDPCVIGTNDLTIGDGTHGVTVLLPSTVTRATIASLGRSAQILYNSNSTLKGRGMKQTTIGGPSDVVAVQQAFGQPSVTMAFLRDFTVQDSGTVQPGSAALQIGGPNSSMPLVAPPAGSMPAYIAANIGRNYFQGAMAEVGFWNSALTPGQIANHYSACSASGASCESTILADSPVAFYPLKEASGTVASDLSGHGYHGTYTGGYSLAAQSGVPGDAGASFASFNGSSGYVLLPTRNWLPGGDFTVEFWAYASVNQTGHTWNLFTAGTSLFNEFYAGFDGTNYGMYAFSVWNPTKYPKEVSAGYNLPTAAWAQIDYVYSNGNMVFYVNGQPCKIGSDVGNSNFENITAAGAETGILLGGEYGGTLYNNLTNVSGTGTKFGARFWNVSKYAGGIGDGTWKFGQLNGPIGLDEEDGGKNSLINLSFENNRSNNGNGVLVAKTSFSVMSTASGYQVGDVVTPTTGCTVEPTLQVNYVNSSGVPYGPGLSNGPYLTVVTPGSGCPDFQTNVSVTGGSGTGLKVDLIASAAMVLLGGDEQVINPYEENSGLDVIGGMNAFVTGALGYSNGLTYAPNLPGPVGSSASAGAQTNFLWGPGATPASIGLHSAQSYIAFNSLTMYDTSYAYAFVPSQPAQPSSLYQNGPVWGGSAGRVYGVYGHAPWFMGLSEPVGGIKAYGKVSFSQISNPAAPILTASGGTGTTSAPYALVCNDNNGGTTLPATPTTTVSGPAVLGALQSVAISNAGNGGYQVNDVVTLVGGSGTGQAKVTAVDGNGNPTAVSVQAAGSLYNTAGTPSAAAVYSTTGGHGSGLTLTATASSITITLPGTDGCGSWSVLKGDTTHQLPAPGSGPAHTGSTNLAANIIDFGAPTLAYSPGSRNTTADVSVAGNLTVAGSHTVSGALGVTGATTLTGGLNGGLTLNGSTSGSVTLSASATGGALNLGSNASVSAAGVLTATGCVGCGNGAAGSDPLDTTSVAINEEFVSAGAGTSGTIGANGWMLGNVVSGTASVSIGTGTWPHVGVVQLRSPAVSGDGGSLYLQGLYGAVLNNNVWDSKWGFAFGVTSGAVYRIGYYPAGSGVVPGAGWYLRFDPTLATPDTTLHLCVASGGEQCYDTGVAPDTAFHVVRIRVITSGTISMTLDSSTERTFCSSGCDVTATPSSANTIYPAAMVVSETASTAESLNLDFFKFLAAGLSR